MQEISGYGKKYGIYVLGGVLLLTLAIRFAVPVRDGDLFWHMKYGQYMVENRTLVPDHSIYSWTPINNKAIYCTWLADIFLYSINRVGGLPLLFAFRYLCVLIVIVLVWIYALRMVQGSDIFTFLILVLVLLTSQSAAYLKPEIISMVFMSLTAFVYFSVKASLWKKWGTKPFLLYPILFLVWVNTHGVFLFGLILLGLITFGEILNYRFNRRCALSDQGMRHLLAGSLLSLVATLVSPYGYKIHISLFNNLILGKSNLGTETVFAYKTIFNSPLSHFSDYWIIMLISFFSVFIFLLWKKRELDWAIFIPTIFLALLFVRYLRCAYYWPSFWGMSLIFLRKNIGPCWQNITKIRTAFKVGIILIFLFLSVRAIYDSKCRPFKREWLGFGVGYFNPEQASAFLNEHRPGELLYNSYNTGGYLIYDLYPVYKVFIDPRYFPYKKLYAEYLKFQNGSTPLNKFSKKYPFDVAIMDYFSSYITIIKFLFSKEWQPAFYGTSGMVFVKKNIGFKCELHKLDKHRFDNLSNLHQAHVIFITAQNLNDLDTSEHVLDLIKNNFSCTTRYKGIVRECSLYQEAFTAFADKNYDKALSKLSMLGPRKITVRANWVLKELWNRKAKQLVEKGNCRAALNLVENILDVYPSSVEALYNAGILSYITKDHDKVKKINDKNRLKHSGMPVKTPNNKILTWKGYLERFLKQDPNHAKAKIAKQVLEGKGLPKKVPLIF